jgi:hypothetical protein
MTTDIIKKKHREELVHLAYCLVKGGYPENKLLERLNNSVKIVSNGASSKQRKALVYEIYNLANDGNASFNWTMEVKEWVENCNGRFNVTECYNELSALNAQNKTAVRVALHRLVKEGVLERDKEKNGMYRLVEQELEEIDFENAPTDVLGFKWPLGLEELVNIYSKNIILIAGCKDSGKTAFMLNAAKMNMNKFKIHYFSSEMGSQELKVRLNEFEEPLSFFKKIKFWERVTDFSDVIRPDDINIIDFMEIHENHYIVGKWLKDIYQKLGKGIAIVALQKDYGVELGRGGYATIEKPRLYMNMEKGIAEIKSGKNWAQKELNPVGLKKRYKLAAGCKFIEESEWVEEIVNWSEVSKKTGRK